MEPTLTYVLKAIIPELVALSSLTYHGASYRKQFAPLPGPVLLESLMFLGSCLLLGFLAAWLMIGESRAHPRKKERERDDVEQAPKLKRKRRSRKKKRAATDDKE